MESSTLVEDRRELKELLKKGYKGRETLLFHYRKQHDGTAYEVVPPFPDSLGSIEMWCNTIFYTKETLKKHKAAGVCPQDSVLRALFGVRLMKAVCREYDTVFKELK